ncbi:putative porin [Winogradskyella sp.]|uniref:putative porin n=1 Tax=Winogradskyella sp. TaxID=1883156 RepID=UPI002617205B|nr:putative porin [Winogradskyella sp.]
MFKIKRILTVIFLVFLLKFSFGQTPIPKQIEKNDSLTQIQKRQKINKSKLKSTQVDDQIPLIEKYKIIKEFRDETFVDTTITITKDYEFNYLQRDNFGLMPFANIGQTYNSLTFDFSNHQANPRFGARARHFNYYEKEDIGYYEVPTPWTRLTYKTAFEQGQMLDAFFTVNLSKQFNFSIAYKGLRSLGNYQNALTSSGNFRFTSNYKTKNNRYKVKAHIVTQDLLNQENGGLLDEEIVNFESGNEDFIDRSVFDMNFQDAENILVGKRYFLEHSYDIVTKNDSLDRNRLTAINKIALEDKFYQFYQDSPSSDFFGDFFTNDVNEKVTLENFNAYVGVEYFNNIIGQLQFGLSYTDINYGYDTLVFLDDEIIPNRIKTSFLSISANYEKKIKNILLKGDAGLNLSDEFAGSFIDGQLSYQLNKDIYLSGGINISSRLPNYNLLLYQSDYTNYNWNNFNTYENINTQQLSFQINSEKYVNASLDISNIDNFTFFNLESNTDGLRVIKPNQYDSSIQYLRLKVQKELRLGNFALDNTIMYQNATSDSDVLNVPTIITRNTLYFSKQIFKKAMTLQTGVTLNYFTEYNMNGYDPLLAEFYTQTETEVGGFPRLDFFINAKVRQTRIFLKAEHFNSSFTGYNYFSAPNHPYRDFTVRFGLVWDFFL